MKGSICDLARAQDVKEDRWRRHASGCPDCRELLAAAEWLTALAATTAPSPDLPPAGYLLFKARIRERQEAVDVVAQPIYAMITLAGILFVIAISAALLGSETRFASIMIDAVRLLASFAGVMVFGAVVIAIVCWVVSHFGKLTDKT